MKIPPLFSSFRRIREENYVYVDKTQHLYNLLASNPFYFFARPRRFGKTLLISTLEELLLGNRELFKGLWIDSSDYAWKSYPVLRFDFSGLKDDSSQGLQNSLVFTLEELAQQYKVDLSLARGFEDTFILLVKKLSQAQRVVILIDEYDFPVINHSDNPALLKKNLKILKKFFTVIKRVETHLQALFITGVSQIPKASIFTGLSNLDNISLDQRAAGLLGYTQTEVETYFADRIAQLAEQDKMSYDELLAKIRHWYNGYRFSKKEITVYNPFSLHYLFTDQKFINYWFDSATPSFLVEFLKRNDHRVKEVGNSVASSRTLHSSSLEHPQLVPLLFQAGYLTITDWNPESGLYTLNFPNHEVELSYSISLLNTLANRTKNELVSDKERYARSASY